MSNQNDKAASDQSDKTVPDVNNDPKIKDKELKDFVRFSSVVSSLPVLGTLLVFLGFSRHQFFFLRYGIRIEEYLEFGEIILLFLPGIFIFLYGIIIFTIAVLLFIVISKQSKYRMLNFLAKEKNIGKVCFIGVFVIASVLWLFDKQSYLSCWGFKYTYTESIIQVIFWSLLAVGIWIMITNLFEKSMNLRLKSLVYVVIWSFIVMALFVINDWHDLENSKETRQFEHKGMDYSTNQLCLYVGQTKDYLFLFDIDNQESIVLSRSEISLTRIKTNFAEDSLKIQD